MTQATENAVKVGRAIISVSDKTGLAEFATGSRPLESKSTAPAARGVFRRARTRGA